MDAIVAIKNKIKGLKCEYWIYQLLGLFCLICTLNYEKWPKSLAVCSNGVYSIRVQNL